MSTFLIPGMVWRSGTGRQECHRTGVIFQHSRSIGCHIARLIVPNRRLRDRWPRSHVGLLHHRRSLSDRPRCCYPGRECDREVINGCGRSDSPARNHHPIWSIMGWQPCQIRTSADGRGKNGNGAKCEVIRDTGEGTQWRISPSHINTQQQTRQSGSNQPTKTTNQQTYFR